MASTKASWMNTYRSCRGEADHWHTRPTYKLHDCCVHNLYSVRHRQVDLWPLSEPGSSSLCGCVWGSLWCWRCSRLLSASACCPGPSTCPSWLTSIQSFFWVKYLFSRLNQEWMKFFYIVQKQFLLEKIIATNQDHLWSFFVSLSRRTAYRQEELHPSKQWHIIPSSSDGSEPSLNLRPWSSDLTDRVEISLHCGSSDSTTRGHSQPGQHTRKPHLFTC